MGRLIKILAWIFAGILLAALSVCLQNFAFIDGFRPELIIAFWAPIIVLTPDNHRILEALPGFFIVDFYSVTPFCLYSFALLGGLYATRSLFAKVFSSVSIITIGAGVFFCALFVRFLLYVLLGFTLLLHKDIFPITVSAIPFALQQAFITSIFSLLTYGFYRKFANSRERHRKKGVIL
jgi:hypothetical protein